MRLIILDNYDKVSDWTARYIKKCIHAFNPGPDRLFTLGLPTGQFAVVLHLCRNYWQVINVFYYLIICCSNFLERREQIVTVGYFDDC